MLGPSLRRHTLGLSLCLLGGAVLAQRPVVTVGGANPDYTDLPMAVAAALPGSVIQVRPGTYTGFVTNKPLRIELEFGGGLGSVLPPPGAAYAITVNGLLAGDEFVLFGYGATVGTGSLGAVRIANTTAPVVIEGINAAALGNRYALDVQNASTVHVRRCVLAGSPGLQAAYTNLSVSESIVIGTDCPGAVVYNAHFDATRTFFSGESQPAMRLFDCAARLSSDGTSSIEVTGNPAGPVSAIEASLCALQFDPTRVGLLPANGAPGLVQLGGYLESDDVPTLVASTASLGMTAEVRMTSSTPRPGLIVLGGLRSTPVLFDLANIFVDTVQAPQILAIGICNQTGLTALVQIPATPVVRGLIQCLQGVVWQPSGWPVLSGPGLWTVL